MKKRYLHVFSDKKFIDYAYRIFENVVPSMSIYNYIDFRGDTRNTDKEYIQILSTKEFLSDENIYLSNSYKAIFFHGFYKHTYKFISRLSAEPVLIWIGMGFDYTPIIYSGWKKMLLSETYKEMCKNHRFFIKEHLGPNYFNRKKIIRLSNRFSYFAPVINSEYDMLKSIVSGFKPRFIDWNYGSSSRNYDVLKKYRIMGDDILIGHSASFLNNHLDAFKYLRDIDLGHRSVVCPLSYGNDWYKKRVIKYGKYFFGKKFNAITEFMPYENYLEKISVCSIAIFNSIRHIGAGNISMCISLGMNVFLREENPIYQLQKSRGLVISSINNSFPENDIYAIKPLNSDDIKYNRDKIFSIFNNADPELKTKNMIKLIMN